jgi:CRP-like cAMP-binding protein
VAIEKTDLGESSPKQNRIIRACPDAEYARLAPDLHLEYLALGTAVLEAGQPARHVYFPTTAVVSLLSVLENGAYAEIAMTGCDGIVGVAAFMGGATTTTRAIVQSAGYAYRMDAALLLKEFIRGGPVHQILLRYMQALVTQMVQTAACNRHHALEQQLCRWLLLSLDLVPSNQLVMTQELIANMLGVRRSGITEAAAKLQARRLITYKRGRITVLSRVGLEKSACECYALVKKEVARLLPNGQGSPLR